MELGIILEIAAIVFGVGVLYGKIQSSQKAAETRHAENISWQKKIELALFGADGRNGLVGDTIKHGEHIKHCVFATRNGDHERG